MVIAGEYCGGERPDQVRQKFRPSCPQPCFTPAFSSSAFFFSSCAGSSLLSGLFLQLRYTGLLLQWPFPLPALAVGQGLPGCRAQAQWLWHSGLSCSWASGIFSDQGFHLCVLHWQVDSLPPSPQRRPLLSLIPDTMACVEGFPASSAGKESACNAGDPGSILGSGRSPGEGIATHSSILGLPLWLSW